MPSNGAVFFICFTPEVFNFIFFLAFEWLNLPYALNWMSKNNLKFIV